MRVGGSECRREGVCGLIRCRAGGSRERVTELVAWHDTIFLDKTKTDRKSKRERERERTRTLKEKSMRMRLMMNGSVRDGGGGRGECYTDDDDEGFRQTRNRT